MQFWSTAVHVMAIHIVSGLERCYDTRRPLIQLHARPRIIFLFFPRTADRARAARVRAPSSDLRQTCIELLDTDSCRGTVPMEPPMSNSSMRHREPIS
jgi:hypothetical protein